MTQIENRPRSSGPAGSIRPERRGADATRSGNSSLPPLEARISRERTAGPPPSTPLALGSGAWGRASSRRANGIASAIEVGFSYFAVLLDGLSIVGASWAANALVRLASFDRLPAYGSVVDLGAIVALLVIVWGLHKNAYGLAGFSSFSGHFGA